MDVEALRCDDDGISVTWIEYFGGEGEEQLHAAAHALKGTMAFKKSGVLARATVGEIEDVMKAAGRDVSVLRDVIDENKAHCLIKGIGADELGELLALAGAFDPGGYVACTDVPGLV
jgi:hypothetical protein